MWFRWWFIKSKQYFPWLQIWSEETYVCDAYPAVFGKTGLFMFIETKDLKSMNTFSITWVMSGMLRILIKSRIFFNQYTKPLMKMVSSNFIVFPFRNLRECRTKLLSLALLTNVCSSGFYINHSHSAKTSVLSDHHSHCSSNTEKLNGCYNRKKI